MYDLYKDGVSFAARPYAKKNGPKMERRHWCLPKQKKQIRVAERPFPASHASDVYAEFL
jgi:hypothetical protein